MTIPVYARRAQSQFCDGQPHRVCRACKDEIIHILRSRRLILLLSLLPLSIPELIRLRAVSTKWKNTMAIVIGTFRAIPFKLCYHKWSGIERRLLRTHWREFAGHSRLMVEAVRGLTGIEDVEKIIRYYKDTNRKYTCVELQCDCHCTENITHRDAIALLHYPSTMDWVSIDETHLKFYMCWLMQEPDLIAKFFPVISKSLTLVFQFYFTCHFIIVSSKKRMRYRELMDTFLRLIPNEWYKELDKTEQFLFQIKNPDNIVLNPVEDVCLPFDPHIKIKHVDVHNVTRLKTYTKPWIVPLETSVGPMNILVKHDDLRKDQFAMNIANLLYEAFRNTLNITRYNVLPVTEDYGIVQMVPHCATLRDIRRSCGLTNFIVQHNLSVSMADIRTTFATSCLSNCVLSYLLGVGDRNLGNILITEQGEMVCIDYAYLLGTDPKLKQFTEMKITASMIDLLGGTDSAQFVYMKTELQSIFSDIQKYNFYWSSLLYYLVTCKPEISGTRSVIEKHIDERLMPNLSTEEIRVSIVDTVDNNSTSSVASWMDTFQDVKTTVEEYLLA